MADAPGLLAALAAELAPLGLNLLGATACRDYDALVPATHRLGAGTWRSAIVIGNGGGAFWSAYETHVGAHPEHAAREHPLDDFTATMIEARALPVALRHGVAVELRFPFRRSEPPLSFVHLAEAAGLGRRSILGIVIHPEFGPWMALRAALLVDAELTAPRPAHAFDPCPTCVERPCVRACPARAVTFPGGWDVPGCVEHRVASAGACAERCEARFDCVYGRAHRYPAAALAYHQRRAFAVMAGAR